MSFPPIFIVFVQAMLKIFAKKKKKKTLEDGTTIDVDEDDDDPAADENNVDEDEEEPAANVEAEVLAEDDQGEVDEDREEYDEGQLAEVIRDVEHELFLDPSLLRVGRIALDRLRRLARRIHFSAALRKAMRDLCIKKGIKPKFLPRSVPTRWNSVTVTIGAALDLQAILDILTSSTKYKITQLHLDEEHWDFLRQIHPMLEVSNIYSCPTGWCIKTDFDYQRFRLSTLHLEQRGKPFLHEVLPAIDNLMTELEEVAFDEEDQPLAIRAAALSGVKVIRKYYALSDESILPRCAISPSSFYLLHLYIY